MRMFLLALSVAGCSATFNDHAPANAGQIYVVGSHDDQAAAWLCPEHTEAPGGCRRVRVIEWLRR